MSARTVRLDPESEGLLRELQEATWESGSSVLKQGLVALRESLRSQAAAHPFSVYAQIDLGPGGKCAEFRGLPERPAGASPA